MNALLYLDHCATTPPCEEAISAAARVQREFFGNPSSLHRTGQRAARELGRARRVLAELLNAKAREIVFCSSGTEANNLALRGSAERAMREQGRARLVVGAASHASVLKCAEHLQFLHGAKAEVILAPVRADGTTDFVSLAALVAEDTTLVSLLHGNNETGALEDLAALQQLRMNRPRVRIHLDVVQSFGKVPLDWADLPADLLTASSHKIHGPRGAAVLVVRDGVELEPLFTGGAQEKFRRAGTEDVAAVCGMAAAAAATPPGAAHAANLARLEAAFIASLAAEGIEFERNGPDETAHRLPGVFNLSFRGVRHKEDLLVACDLEGLQVSAASACHSGVVADSHVLTAMGLPAERRQGAIRFGLSRYQSELDMREAARRLALCVHRLVVSRTENPRSHAGVPSAGDRQSAPLTA